MRAAVMLFLHPDNIKEEVNINYSCDYLKYIDIINDEKQQPAQGKFIINHCFPIEIIDLLHPRVNG
jgi:hypothetical protein